MTKPFTATTRHLAHAAVAACCGFLASSVWAQASSPSEGVATREGTPSGAASPAGVATRNVATNAAGQLQGDASTRALKQGDLLSIRGGLITQVGSGQPVVEGSRILRLPGKCTPKTGSLDCVAEAGQPSNGANVSSKVRHGVIGEVGAGRAATEGGGSVKHNDACTPAPGKLRCE